MVTVRVTDNGVPSLSASRSFSILVASPPVIESIHVSDSSVTISWDTVAGRKYRVQFKSDLGQLTWSDLAGDVTATGAMAEKTDTSSATQRSYRVLLLP